MNKKSIPSWIQNPLLIKILKTNIGVVFSYWLFQGILYMDIREKTFKLFLDLLLTLLFYKIGLNLLFSFIIAHTINMFFNGHFYVLKHNLGKLNNEPSSFIQYIEKFSERINSQKYLLGAASYGSLSRNEFKTTSDFDLRVFPKKSVVSWVKALFWIMSERALSFIHKFPMDIYAFDLSKIDEKMRSDEPPIIFYDPQNELKKKYSNYVLLEDFLLAYKEKYVKDKE